MDDYDFTVCMDSPVFLELEQEVDMDSADSSRSSASLLLAKPAKAKKFFPPAQDEMKVELEEEIQHAAESGECNLSQMLLPQVPASLPLETLVTLVLSGNQLTELPESLFEGRCCRHLVKFDANSNQLKAVPQSLLVLPKLEVLLLDHNNITAIPFDGLDLNQQPLLPALNFVGLEFNELQAFPVEFFIHCPLLSKIFIGQNEKMLEAPVPTGQLLRSTVAQRHGSNNNHNGENRVILKVDNRPCFVKQVLDERWDTTMPWLEVQFHKIYPDRVLGFMYLGSLRTAQTRTVYRDLNIDYILSIARGMEVRVDPGMKHLVLPVEDIPGEDIQQLFEQAFTFIDEAREKNKGVLLHCFAGLSRSVTVAAAYLMSRCNMTRDEALDFIRKARPAAQPNPGFMGALWKFEKLLEERRGEGSVGQG
ncbi:phopshatase [Trypanosoma rangeli]|uniref:protein-tyrosine-phosphatase n=1 Tax=Trypanosoma rangeli TaxID=5698 RepID=A0A3R7KS85_TRYRA|nr:phopshatase [Trypanosoma rangeli]RNF00340.1 phopshatase [Trypanosoma rangeli]|eukprot:RNF00340.1 phopshatase [Trypanosoma rangeli]